MRLMLTAMKLPIASLTADLPKSSHSNAVRGLVLIDSGQVSEEAVSCQAAKRVYGGL